MREGVRWGTVIVLGLLAGAIMWMTLELTQHIWGDHTRLHELYDLELRRAAAVAAQPK